MVLTDDVLDRIDEIVPPGLTVNPAENGWAAHHPSTSAAAARGSRCAPSPPFDTPADDQAASLLSQRTAMAISSAWSRQPIASSWARTALRCRGRRDQYAEAPRAGVHYRARPRADWLSTQRDLRPITFPPAAVNSHSLRE
jgi:hypothetical protein